MNSKQLGKLVYTISRDPSLQDNATVAKLNKELATMPDASKLRLCKDDDSELKATLKGVKNDRQTLRSENERLLQEKRDLQMALNELRGECSEAKAAAVKWEHFVGLITSEPFFRK